MLNAIWTSEKQLGPGLDDDNISSCLTTSKRRKAGPTMRRRAQIARIYAWEREHCDAPFAAQNGGTGAWALIPANH